MYNQYPFAAFNPNYTMPLANTTPTSGLGGLLGLGKKAFNWDGFLNNAQRTLNVINQAMPIYNQVKPMFKNMGTVFRVIGELNKPSINVNNQSVDNASNSIPKTSNTNNPQFFA